MSLVYITSAEISNVTGGWGTCWCIKLGSREEAGGDVLSSVDEIGCRCQCCSIQKTDQYVWEGRTMDCNKI